MTPDHPKRCGKAAIVGLTVLAALGASPRAGAQHTPDPYNFVGEYNRGLEPYMYPTYPNGLNVVPNQAELEGYRSGVSRFNQYQSFLEELDGLGVGDEFSATRPRSIPGVPYYRAHRPFDSAYGRSYRPNATADRAYYQDQAARHERYMRDQQEAREAYDNYLRERDPARRAQFYRRYVELSQKATRSAGTARGAAPTADRGASDRTPAPPLETSPGTRVPELGGSARGRSNPLEAPAPSGRGAGADLLTPDRLGPRAPALSSDSEPSPWTSPNPSELDRDTTLMDRIRRNPALSSPARRPVRNPSASSSPAPR